jgi:hypothetical protein
MPSILEILGMGMPHGAAQHFLPMFRQAALELVSSGFLWHEHTSISVVPGRRGFEDDRAFPSGFLLPWVEGLGIACVHGWVLALPDHDINL